MILTTTYEGNPRATVLNGSEKFTSLKKVSVTKLYSSNLRYFPKQREIDRSYLRAKSKISQSRFSQLPY